MTHGPRRSLRAISLFALLAASTNAEAATTTVAQQGDASISHEASAGTWTLAAGGASLTLALDPSRDFAIVSLLSASGTSWAIGTQADSTVRLDGRSLAFGNRNAGFAFESASVVTRGATLELDATFKLAAGALTVTRHYAVVSGSPTFEAWTTYRGTGAVLSDLNALQMTVPNGTLNWLTGLQGDAANVPTDSAFTLQRQTLSINSPFTIGASHRASEHTVPWFSIDGGKDEFYGALMWSGAWSAVFERTGAGTVITIGLPPMSTTLTSSAVDGPHMLFGVAPGAIAEGTGALRSYVTGRPSQRTSDRVPGHLQHLVRVRNRDRRHVDAHGDGSRRGTGRRVVRDRRRLVPGNRRGGTLRLRCRASAGGQPIRRAFPTAWVRLREYAHSLGMQFGLWVEPERVNLSLVGAPGVEEAWLATEGGQYGSDHAGQICLANAAARQWLMDRLTTLIDEVQPDYLKWDNNMFVNCDRGGHGHGPADGNFAHTGALYDMFSQLRARYPDMLIENVSGGGNRLDIGMLRFTDVAWMDDRTAPSVHVRHNIQGLSAVFPPAYLLSFVTDHDTEPLHDAPDLSLYFRSRMSGALGLCFRGDSFTEDEDAGMAREIAIYKAARATITHVGRLPADQTSVT